MQLYTSLLTCLKQRERNYVKIRFCFQSVLTHTKKMRCNTHYEHNMNDYTFDLKTERGCLLWRHFNVSLTRCRWGLVKACQDPDLSSSSLPRQCGGGGGPDEGHGGGLESRGFSGERNKCLLFLQWVICYWRRSSPWRPRQRSCVKISGEFWRPAVGWKTQRWPRLESSRLDQRKVSKGNE